jgi:magnesium transporter
MAAAPAYVRVRRFDADRRDREISLEEAMASPPSDRQLLWIDLTDTVEAEALAAIGKRFEFDPQTSRAIATAIREPKIAVHGAYFHLSVAAEPAAPEASQVPWLNILCGRNVVITRHDGTLALLDELDRRITADATLGAVEGAEFVALLLESVLTSYFAVVDEIEDQIGVLDARSLRDDARHPVLDDLVALRRRIARLRRVVAGHRTVFASLAGPDIRQVISSDDAAADLQAVTSRYEAAVAAIESSRDALLGSFDVAMTRTAQRTNEIVKVLTIATVLLLPGSVIAGLMGMNVVVPLDKDSPLSFWLVVAGVVTLAVVVIITARLRRWI